MNEIEGYNFNYSALDDHTAKFLKSKENNMKEVVANAYTQLGKELKEAQDELAGDNQHNGIFQEWYKSLGFKKQTVYNLINRYSLVVQNLDKQELIEDLPLSLSYEISKGSADEELKQKVLEGDIKTHKEYKKLLAEKKELEESNEFLQEIRDALSDEKNKMEDKIESLEELKEKAYKRILEYQEKLNKKPEVIEKEIIPDEVQKKIDELEKRAGDLEKHKAEVNDYQKKSRELYEEINQLQEYKKRLKEQNDIEAQRAEVVQGIRSEINKLRKGQGRIEELLNRDIQLSNFDLNSLSKMADFLNEMAEKIYEYTTTQRTEAQIYDIPTRNDEFV